MDKAIAYRRERRGRSDRHPALHAVYPKKAMPRVEQVTKRFQFPAQSFRRVVPMVKMDFDLSESAPAKRSQLIEDILVVVFLGVEECVPGHAPIRIEKGTHRIGIGSKPVFNRSPRFLGACAFAKRLKMITEAEDQVPDS
jgi:hypothetical protein